MKKRTLRAIFVSSALALCGGAVFGFSGMNSYTGSANTNLNTDFPCSYSAAPRDREYMCYGSSEVIKYTAEEAAAASIPEGYENEVLKVVPLADQSSTGVLLDFTEQEIPVCLVDNLTFRMYVESHTANTGSRPQARIAEPFDINNAWIHQPGSTPTPTDMWTEVVVENTDGLFNKIAVDGNLAKFEFSVRSNVRIPFYLDSISYTMKENDGVAPIISYNGGDTIYTNEGAKFDFTATAHDAQENRDVEVEYVWADPTVVQADGSLCKGTHSLTLRAQDYYGNVAEKTLTIVVAEVDKEFPVIHVNADTVYATIGTKPMIEFTATDNSGNVETGLTWSAGALDNRGRLVEGTHTLTLYAIDPSNNRTQKIITFYVNETGDPEDNVVDEENMAAKYTVTFDGENASEYIVGSKINQPQDPTKADENGYSYTFIGWYYGDKKWDFEKDTITENLELVSKYETSLIVYRVTFRASGRRVAEMTYTVEDREIEEPEVPEKSGYVGKWEEYTLTTGNITVNAVYTKIEDLPPETSEKPEDSEAPETSEKPEVSEAPETSEKPEDSEASEGTSEELPETSESTSEPKKEGKSKGGCGGIATAGTIAMMAAIGGALLLKKKED